MGVAIFRDAAPANFNTFDRALSTMFRLTAGETWIDGLAAYSAEDGSLYYGSALFIYSYIVIVVWILLQVSVAVLLVRARAPAREAAPRVAPADLIPSVRWAADRGGKTCLLSLRLRGSDAVIGLQPRPIPVTAVKPSESPHRPLLSHSVPSLLRGQPSSR